MNRKKPKKLYNFKKSSDEIKTKSKSNDNNNNKIAQKKSENRKFLLKKSKIEENADKTKSNMEESAPTMQTMNSPPTSQLKNTKENSELNNEKNQTPQKRKISNESQNKNNTEEDFQTSFEKKPSELKSPETISEDSFTSSYEPDDKDKNKNEYKELIFVDKIKNEVNEDLEKNNKKKEEKEEKEENFINKIKVDNGNILNNLKIKVNKSPRESKNKREEIIPYIPINQRKKEANNISSNNIHEKKNKNEKLLLTNVKAIKQKKFFIQTEDKKNKYMKKYAILTKNNNYEMNKSQSNLNKESKNEKNNDIIVSNDNINNNKTKSRNMIEQTKKNKLENKKLIAQKKNAIIINKTINNKFGLNVDDLNSFSKETNPNKNLNYTTLSRNISFHNNSKKIVYAPKKLVSSTVLKSPKKTEIQAYNNTGAGTFIHLNDKIKNALTSMKSTNKKINLDEHHIIKSNPEQIRKRIFELHNGYNSKKNLGASIKNNNQIILDNNLKNNNNFFIDNNSYLDFLKNSPRHRNSITNLYSNNDIQNKITNNLILNEQMKNAKNLQLINLNLLGNKLLSPNNISNNTLNNSTGEINTLNNFYLQNLFQYNFNPNNNNNITTTKGINDSSSLNYFLINFEDLIILQKYLQEMIISLSKNKPIQNECFEFWNYYYNSSILPQFEKIFLNQQDSTEVKLSIYYSLMSIMLCYDYSFETDIFIKAILSLIDILKLNYKNLILICEYILKKISRDSLTNNWVLKLSAIVNESNYNDFTNQILSKGYNMTIIEKISYNTNIILQNLRYLLKNFKSKKNGILTGIFKKIKEKTYEEINTFFRENIMRVSNINGSILGSIFLLKNTNFKPVPNPYVRTKNNKEFSLVLDLDETLIHFKPQNNGEDGGILRARPGIYKFLDEVGKYYELIVFTTATQDYADELIDAIEEDKIYFEHRFYREHATIIDNDFVKDLSRIGRPLDKIIIIDNMPQNFRLQKENGIIIKAFWGEDNSDTALIELIPILVNIAKEGGDVRNGLVKYKDDIIRKVTSCFSKSDEV